MTNWLEPQNGALGLSCLTSVSPVSRFSNLMHMSLKASLALVLLLSHTADSHISSNSDLQHREVVAVNGN